MGLSAGIGGYKLRSKWNSLLFPKPEFGSATPKDLRRSPSAGRCKGDPLGPNWCPLVLMASCGWVFTCHLFCALFPSYWKFKKKKNTDSNFILLLSGRPWTSSAALWNVLGDVRASSLLLGPVCIWSASEVTFTLNIVCELGKLSDLWPCILINWENYAI